MTKGNSGSGQWLRSRGVEIFARAKTLVEQSGPSTEEAAFAICRLKSDCRDALRFLEVELDMSVRDTPSGLAYSRGGISLDFGQVFDRGDRYLTCTLSRRGRLGRMRHVSLFGLLLLLNEAPRTTLVPRQYVRNADFAVGLGAWATAIRRHFAPAINGNPLVWQIDRYATLVGIRWLRFLATVWYRLEGVDKEILVTICRTSSWE